MAQNVGDAQAFAVGDIAVIVLSTPFTDTVTLYYETVNDVEELLMKKIDGVAIFYETSMTSSGLGTDTSTILSRLPDVVAALEKHEEFSSYAPLFAAYYKKNLQ